MTNIVFVCGDLLQSLQEFFPASPCLVMDFGLSDGQRNPLLLASLKAKVAIHRKTSTPFDTERFTRHIEAGCTTIWERHQRGEPPAGVIAPALPQVR